MGGGGGSLKDHRESECRAGAEAARTVRLYLGLLTVESPPPARYLLLLKWAT